MQLTIDTDTATAHGLITTAAYLLGLSANPEATAMLKAIREVQAGGTSAPNVPSGTVAAPPAPFVPPPPPPAPTIPAAPVADTTETTAAPTGTSASSAPAVDPNAQLDKRGFPYDARIHSTSTGGGGTINKSDGLWRTKRGVDNALIESVEAELRATGYGVAVPPAPLTPPAPPAPPAPPGAVPPPPPPPVIPQPPMAPSAPGGAPAVPGSDGAGQVDQFRVLMNTIGGHTGPDGKCRREVMAPIYERLLGKPGGLPDFHKARDKIPELLVKVRELIGA